MAEGGKIGRFCGSERDHLPECSYHVKRMASGGSVSPNLVDHAVQVAQSVPSLLQQKAASNRAQHQAKAMPKENPALMAGHVAILKGLSGLLKDSGRSNIQDHDKHIRTLQDARDHHALKKQTPDIASPRHTGGKLGHALADGDHDKAGDVLNGHPLVGLVGSKQKKAIMERMADPMLSKDPHPAAFRSSVDYLAHADKGSSILNKHIDGLFSKGSEKVKISPRSIEDLKEFIDKSTANPESLLDVGGDMGHYLPDHGAQIGALSGAAVQYLSSLKPFNMQLSPLDKVLPPSASAISDYDRQLHIAENPLAVFQHAKAGTLLPTDIATLNTVYPALGEDIKNKIGQQIIESTSKGEQVPYSMRSSVSMLLGSPLDSTMTQPSMQAIIQAQAPKNRPDGQQGGQKRGGGITQASAKFHSKADSLIATPLQAHQMNRKD